MTKFAVLATLLLLTGCELVARAQPQPTPPPGGFVQRYANPEEIAPVATLAAVNCGKPYFGTYCRQPDGSYGYAKP